MRWAWRLRWGAAPRRGDARRIGLNHCDRDGRGADFVTPTPRRRAVFLSKELWNHVLTPLQSAAPILGSAVLPVTTIFLTPGDPQDPQSGGGREWRPSTSTESLIRRMSIRAPRCSGCCVTRSA